MRARAALAAVLWRRGWREETVEHQRELLRLNPRYNQGLRYRQAHWLLELEAYDELEELFAVYADDRVPGFICARVLAAVRRHGDDASSRGLLAEARAQPAHPHLPDGQEEAARAAPRLRRLRRGDRGGRLRGWRRRAVGQRAGRAGLPSVLTRPAGRVEVAPVGRPSRLGELGARSGGRLRRRRPCER
jgi:hypothetical protein